MVLITRPVGFKRTYGKYVGVSKVFHQSCCSGHREVIDKKHTFWWHMQSQRVRYAVVKVWDLYKRSDVSSGFLQIGIGEGAWGWS